MRRSPANANTCTLFIAPARSISFAVGETRGAEADVGSAMSTDVMVVESGIEAERSARSAVWSRCGRRGRVWAELVGATRANTRAGGAYAVDAARRVFLR
jgi:hypothetical protein